MTTCELSDTCIFFNDRMPDMPAVAGYLKDKYCHGNFVICARYRIYTEFGRELVPAGLFPNEEDMVPVTAAELRKRIIDNKGVISMTVTEANTILAEADLLVRESEVSAAIGRIADEITELLKGANPVLLCIMNGGLIFTGQLLTRLVFPLEVDYVHATRYGHEISGASLHWTVKPQLDLKGRTVLLLDDILDEGVTLAAIAGYCRQQGAAEVYMAVLVEKLHLRKVTPGMRADFTGIEVGDRFLFGYGLDYKGYWRNAPGIYAVKK